MSHGSKHKGHGSQGDLEGLATEGAKEAVKKAAETQTAEAQDVALFEESELGLSAGHVHGPEGDKGVANYVESVFQFLHTTEDEDHALNPLYGKLEDDKVKRETVADVLERIVLTLGRGYNLTRVMIDGEGGYSERKEKMDAETRIQELKKIGKYLGLNEQSQQVQTAYAELEEGIESGEKAEQRSAVQKFKQIVQSAMLSENFRLKRQAPEQFRESPVAAYKWLQEEGYELSKGIGESAAQGYQPAVQAYSAYQAQETQQRVLGRKTGIRRPDPTVHNKSHAKHH
ncbi:hypothetical protein J4410_03625 [Candidatus Woesearchaeota archaeon]|nr:hypothetical protein [Candidatus Woesearchaeota archaeon]